MTLKPEEINFDEEWLSLRETIDKVINVRNISHKEWTQRFSNIYRICVAHPEPLWERLYDETHKFLDDYVGGLFKEFENLPNNELLKQYHHRWNNYQKGVKYLNELYLYINTQHIKKQKFTDPDISFGNIKINEQKLEIRELGLYFWEKNMIEPLKDKLVYLLLEAIENDRLGKECDETIIIKDIVLSFVDVEVYTKKHELYENVFEKPFLIATGEFYKKESELLVQTCNCSEYMEKAQQRLSAESLRSTKFLHQSSYNKVREECENRLIADHLTLLHSECKSMVLSEARRDLKNMYLLLKNVKDGLPVFIKEVQNYITETGLNSVASYLVPNDQVAAVAESKDARESPVNFVENVLEVHRKFSELIKDVFVSDQQFVRALDKACSTIINHKKNSKYPCKAPELLAKYCDALLKKSANKGINESEIDDKLSMSIVVFRYIDDKDVFQKFYSKMLGKRLIHSLSVSMENEESMINKLKQACGHEFTSKLHRMFTDIRLSGDLIKQFNNWCNSTAEPQLSIGFNIFVLQAGAWPIYPTPISPFELPLPLEQCVTKFEKFYYQKFNGRKLTWLNFLSTCDVKMYLDKKTYLVTMSCYLMGILLQFNSSSSKLTYQHLQENTKITDEQLTRHLILLIDTKLITLEPNLPNYSNVTKFDSDQVFALNLSYVNKRTKFRLATLPPKETSQQMDIEQTQASVDENRKLFLQAVIVRIMKSRKIIKHNALIQEVTQITNNRFTPSLQMIKICIEALIEKQYLERTSSTDEYSYVA